MIQINLLPDVKREYLKAQQIKHAVIVISVILSITMIALAVLLFVYVRFLQPQHRVNIQKDIDSGVVELKANKNAVEIVTVQGALEQIGPLQDKKLITSRVFEYVTSFTPRGVGYNSIRFDTTTGIATLSGVTSSHEKLMSSQNNIKAASFTYEQGDQELSLLPFSAVVFNGLSSSDASETNQRVSFEITFQMAATLFDQSIENGKVVINKSTNELLPPNADPFNETNETEIPIP